MYFGTNKFSEKLSLHSEVQYRNHTISPTNIEQLLLRTGLNYHFNSNALATFGYAHIGNYEFESEQKSPESEEHRIGNNFLTSNNTVVNKIWSIDIVLKNDLLKKILKPVLDIELCYLSINKKQIEKR